MFTELKNRGVGDVLLLCCDGVKRLPDSARATWALVDVQLCVVHLVRNSLRYAAAMKVLFLTAIEKRKNRTNPTGRINGWKSILNTLTIHYHDRRGHQLTVTIPVTHTTHQSLSRPLLRLVVAWVLLHVVGSAILTGVWSKLA